MDIIQFYLPNIIVGSLLAIALSLYGSHIVARNKTVEILLLGQSIQVGILFGVVFINALFDIHEDHGLHPEVLVSLLFTSLIFVVYHRLTRLRLAVKTPILVSMLALLMALGYLVVASSPLVESHMVKSYLGDIVTASLIELYVILGLSVLSLFFYFYQKRIIELQSFDLALFDHLIQARGKKVYWLFNIIVLILMISSIHVLGLIYTLCMMVFPITVIQFTRLGMNQFIKYIVISSPLSVIIGFLLNIQYEHLPTSGLITISNLTLAGIVLFLTRLYYKKGPKRGL